MRKVMYCEKCGQIYCVFFSKRCNFCGTKMKLLPEAMKEKYNIFNDSWSELWGKLDNFVTANEENRIREEMLWRERDFVMNELVNNPVFSMEEYEKQVQMYRQKNKKLTAYHHEEMLERQSKNIARMQKEADKRNYVPRCPVCGSSNIGKITVAKRAAKTAVFGAIGAMDDIGKTWKCNNCGSKF